METKSTTSSQPHGSPASPGARKLRIGVAGWSYPDWRGTFYPATRPRGFSELRFAAERFDCLEVNSTFYRLPEARLATGWLQQVEGLPDFRFTAKLHRDLTHDRLPREDIARLCAQYLEGLRPLREADVLACILVQFPWSFDDRPDHRERLRWLADGLRPVPLVVEVRHVSFLCRGENAALPFFEKLGLNFANIDLPRSATSPPATCINTGPIGYVRLHGRNAATWFQAGAGRDQKYDYLYSPAELLEIRPTIERLAGRTQATFVVANNHYRAQAPANAIELIRMTGVRDVDVPEQLRREFPFLEETA